MAATVAVHFLAMRLACCLCGHEVRIDPDHVDDLSEAASAWWVEHQAPHVVCVEVEAGGEIQDWVQV